jgi:hypothetical protein
MRSFYILTTSVFLLFIILTGCSKDFLKRYDKRIIGTWKVTDIDGYGLGGSLSLPFPEQGIFTFSDDGQLTYSYSGTTYQGSWDIRKEQREDETINSLHLTAIDFTNQEVRTEYFNEMRFTSTDRFKAFIYSGLKTYVYHFVRQ